MEIGSEKTTETYWSKLWQNQTMPRLVDQKDRSLKNHVRLSFARFFTKHLVPKNQNDKHLIELGCARSVWLPFFIKDLNMQAEGLDYSQIGCQQAEFMLKTANAMGKIHCADMFSPPKDLLGTYDFVVSMGLIEHFTETDKAIRACAEFASPDGKIVTMIPNMTGAPGFLQKYFNKEIYNIHVPLSAEQLQMSHQSAGLKVVEFGYLLFSNFGVLNADSKKNFSLELTHKVLLAFSALTWILERIGIPLPPNRFTSPYVYCVAVKSR